MTILSYASPYNVQLELVNGNNKLRSSGSSKADSTSPKPGRQSPLVHPLVRSSSQSDLNTVRLAMLSLLCKMIVTKSLLYRLRGTHAKSFSTTTAKIIRL